MTIDSVDQADLINQARERYNFIVDRGSYLPGVSDLVDPCTPPEWFDRDKFNKCQQIADKYFLSLSYSSSVGLLLGIQIPIFTEPLLTTGNHKNIPKLYRRYLSTVLHVKSWYEHDPFLKGSPAYKSIHQVRSMHKKVFELMNKKSGKVIGQDRVWVSQCEMAMTQWAFFALLILYPKECAGHGLTQSDLEHVIYLWRVLGHCMGIEDRFNLGQGTLDECRALYKVILDDFMRPKLSETPHPYQIGYDVSHGIAKALRPVNPEIRFNVILNHWYKILDIPYEVPLKPIHRVRLMTLQFTLNTTLKSPMLYSFANKKQKKRVEAQIKKKEKVEKQLTNKYPNIVYENKCPFACDLGYTDIFGAKDDSDKLLNNNNNTENTDDIKVPSDQNANTIVT